MLTDSCYILCFICGKCCLSDVYNNGWVSFYLYSQMLIVNAVLHSFKGSVCNIFKHRFIIRQLGIIAINNETTVEMIDSLCPTPVVFLVQVTSSPIIPLLPMLHASPRLCGIFGFTEEDEHVGDDFFFCPICLSLPSTICQSENIWQISLCLLWKWSNPEDFPPNPCQWHTM